MFSSRIADVPRLSLQLKRIVTSQNPDRAKKKRKLEEGLDGHGTNAEVKPKNYKKKARRGKKKKAPPSNPRKEKVRFSEMFRLPFEVLSEVSRMLFLSRFCDFCTTLDCQLPEYPGPPISLSGDARVALYSAIKIGRAHV